MVLFEPVAVLAVSFTGRCCEGLSPAGISDLVIVVNYVAKRLRSVFDLARLGRLRGAAFALRE